MILPFYSKSLLQFGLGLTEVIQLVTFDISMSDYKEWEEGIVFISLFVQKAILQSYLLISSKHYNHVLEKNPSSTKTNRIFTVHQKNFWNRKMTQFYKSLTEMQRLINTNSPSWSYP